MQPPSPCDVSVSVFCQNEAARIGACLSSIAAAGRDFRLDVTVIANGTTDGSVAQAKQALRAQKIPARIYTIAHGDKSNAINLSFYALRKPARLHVAVDAYAIIAPDTFRGFAAVLSTNAHAVAASGVAGNGRFMKAMSEATLREGGRLHGQLHALRPAFLDRLTGAGIRLPIGLYRGDGLLASMCCHDLSPLDTPWDGARIKGTVEAEYSIPRISPFRPADVVRQWRRKIRQMRGLLENAALQTLIYKHGFGGFPEYADEMISTWLAAGNTVSVSGADRFFMRLALRRIAGFVRPDPDALAPVLVFEQE